MEEDLQRTGCQKKSRRVSHSAVKKCKKPSRTITTIPEDLIHYRQNRIPTVREMARLQSFPDDFEFLGPKMTGGKSRRTSCPQYTQVANAVPPLLAEEMFKKIKPVLSSF